MLPISAKDVHEFKPDDGSGAAYYVATPTIATRARYQRDLVASGVTAVSQERLHDLRLDAVGHAVRAELAEQATALLNRARDGDELDEVEVDNLETLLADLRRASPELAQAEADWKYYLDMASYHLCRHFLVGASGIDAPFERQHGITADATLLAIPADHLVLIAGEAIRLLHPTRKQEKNSRSPSRSRSSPRSRRTPTSPAARGGPSSESGMNSATVIPSIE